MIWSNRSKCVNDNVCVCVLFRIYNTYTKFMDMATISAGYFGYFLVIVFCGQVWTQNIPYGDSDRKYNATGRGGTQELEQCEGVCLPIVPTII